MNPAAIAVINRSRLDRAIGRVEDQRGQTKDRLSWRKQPRIDPNAAER